MRINQILIPLLSIFLFQCSHEAKEKTINEKYTSDNVKIINIIPFKGMPKEDVIYVTNKLSKIYPHLKIQNEINFPKSAFNKERKRYRADSLINFLASITQEKCISIGLTNLDISTTKNDIADWGVMGLGFRPGNACIASSFRLSKTNTQEQLFKVSIHELGHTQGLVHCPIKTCFMQKAEGKNPTDQEIDFCSSCKSKLKDKGWKF